MDWTLVDREQNADGSYMSTFSNGVDTTTYYSLWPVTPEEYGRWREGGLDTPQPGFDLTNVFAGVPGMWYTMSTSSSPLASRGIWGTISSYVSGADNESKRVDDIMKDNEVFLDERAKKKATIEGMYAAAGKYLNDNSKLANTFLSAIYQYEGVVELMENYHTSMFVDRTATVLDMERVVKGDVKACKYLEKRLSTASDFLNKVYKLANAKEVVDFGRAFIDMVREIVETKMEVGEIRDEVEEVGFSPIDSLYRGRRDRPFRAAGGLYIV